MSQSDKALLIERLDESRSKLQAILNQIDLQQEIYPTWTIKHLLAHISGWDEACIAAIQAFLGGTEPGTPAVKGIDFYNAQSVETRQYLPYEHVRKEWEATRETFKSLIHQVPDGQIHDDLLTPWGTHSSVIKMVEIFVYHEAQHAKEIEELIAGVSGVDSKSEN
jgi:hypothetical protein